MANLIAPRAKPDEILTFCKKCGVSHSLSVPDGIAFIEEFELGPVPDQGGVTVVLHRCAFCALRKEEILAKPVEYVM